MQTSGTGAVSTGSMVPVFAARDVGTATKVVDLLESHEIPAIVDSELAGPTGLSLSDRPRVWVPSTMLPAAKAILQDLQAEAPATRVATSAGQTWSTWSPAQIVPSQAPTLPPEPPELVVEAPVPDEIMEPAMPEQGPTAPRLGFALAAIAFGLILQRGLEGQLGIRGAVQAFGASAAVLQEPWRLVTAGFMHGSLSHMLSNAGFGLLIGVVLFGTHRIGATCLVWLLASFAGIGAELLMSPNVVVIGASAGNYGLVGLLAFGQLQRSSTMLLPRRERIRTVGLMLLLVPGAFTPFSATGTKIAVIAHGVGFLVGLLSGVFFKRRLNPEGFASIDWRSKVAGGIAGLVTVVGTGAALLDTFR